MKTISLAVSEEDYEAFRAAARQRSGSIAQLIREAMTFFREEKLERRPPLRGFPVLTGHRVKSRLPLRAEVYDEIFGGDEN